MIKADKYFLDTLSEIESEGLWDKNPRPKWKDGSVAFSKYLTQKVYTYDISKGEFPIITLRNTPLSASYHDIETIYQKQTNVIEEMHPSIYKWWIDFLVRIYTKYDNGKTKEYSTIGRTYGDTVKRYNLMNRLLENLESNPFSRRHILSLWQEQQMIDDTKALTPCAFQTLWYPRDIGNIRYIDLTLVQRSMDYIVTASINPAQYTMLCLMVCGHLTKVTGIKHKMGKLLHIVNNLHVYDRHFVFLQELKNRKPLKEGYNIELLEDKNFYEYRIEDFHFSIPNGILPLSKPIEIAS